MSKCSRLVLDSLNQSSLLVRKLNSSLENNLIVIRRGFGCKIRGYKIVWFARSLMMWPRRSWANREKLFVGFMEFWLFWCSLFLLNYIEFEYFIYFNYWSISKIGHKCSQKILIFTDFYFETNCSITFSLFWENKLVLLLFCLLKILEILKCFSSSSFPWILAYLISQI